MKPCILLSLLYIAYPIVYLYTLTLRIHAIIDPESSDILRRDRGIFTNYHNQLIPLCLYFKKKGRCVLVSRSRDGNISDFFLKKLGYETIRGSSSDEGTDALFNIRKALRKNIMLSLTSDGPKGPVYKLKKGIVWLANRHKYPILFAYAYFSKARRIRSWDGLYFPYPFSRILIVVEKPYINEEWLSKNEIEEQKDIIEKRMWGGYVAYAGRFKEIYKKYPENMKEIQDEEK